MEPPSWSASPRRGQLTAATTGWAAGHPFFEAGWEDLEDWVTERMIMLRTFADHRFWRDSLFVSMTHYASERLAPVCGQPLVPPIRRGDPGRRAPDLRIQRFWGDLDPPPPETVPTFSPPRPDPQDPGVAIIPLRVSLASEAADVVLLAERERRLDCHLGAEAGWQTKFGVQEVERFSGYVPGLLMSGESSEPLGELSGVEASRDTSVRYIATAALRRSMPSEARASPTQTAPCRP